MSRHTHGGPVLIAAPAHPLLVSGLEEAGYTVRYRPDVSPEEARAVLADCAGLVTATRLRVDRVLLDRAPQLRWVGRLGSGLEIIDLEAAAARGVAVYASPEGNRTAVAEHALGLLLSVTKRIVHAAREVREGAWLRDENRGTELSGRTAGIIGYGNTGQAFARVLRGLDMKVLAYDIRQTDGRDGDLAECGPLSRIFEEASVVSFHVPLRADTVHYLSDDFVAQMRHPFFLVNTARGPVVDGAAVLRGLQAGRILGAGLDVWETEPPAMGSARSQRALTALLAHPQVVVTPHIGGYSHEATEKMSRVLLDRVLGGGER